MGDVFPCHSIFLCVLRVMSHQENQYIFESNICLGTVEDTIEGVVEDAVEDHKYQIVYEKYLMEGIIKVNT